jgi:hypothetical protein
MAARNGRNAGDIAAYRLADGGRLQLTYLGEGLAVTWFTASFFFNRALNAKRPLHETYTIPNK